MAVVSKGSYGVTIVEEVTKRTEISDEAKREVEILQRLDHVNIIKVLGVTYEGRWIKIRMPLVIYGGLADLVAQLPANDNGSGGCSPGTGGRLGWIGFFDIFGGLTAAIAYLAAQDPPVLHRDIKPDNILVDVDTRNPRRPRLVVKLIGFDCARTAPGDDAERTIAGTPRYMAPEAAAGRPSPASDVYDVGCVLMWLLLGFKPYEHIENVVEIAAARAAGEHPFGRHDGGDAPKDVLELLRAATDPDPSKRPTAAQLHAAVPELRFNHCFDSEDDYYRRWDALLQPIVGRTDQQRPITPTAVPVPVTPVSSVSDVCAYLAGQNVYTAVIEEVRQYNLDGAAFLSATFVEDAFGTVQQTKIPRLHYERLQAAHAMARAAARM